MEDKLYCQHCGGNPKDWIKSKTEFVTESNPLQIITVVNEHCPLCFRVVRESHTVSPETTAPQPHDRGACNREATD